MDEMLVGLMDALLEEGICMYIGRYIPYNEYFTKHTYNQLWMMDGLLDF
jgi:hypothetical protein